LLARNQTEARIDQIWGGNFLRVLASAEAAARRWRRSFAINTQQQ